MCLIRSEYVTVCVCVRVGGGGGGGGGLTKWNFSVFI